MASASDDSILEIMATKIDTNQVSFLDLPRIVRNKIYCYALVASDGSVTIRGEPTNQQHRALERTSPVRNGLSPQLLRTCKTIRREATPILYAKNRFHIKRDSHGGWFYRMGDSIKFLRDVEFSERYSLTALRSCFRKLQEAPHLERLAINQDCFTVGHIPHPERMYRALRPLVRASTLRTLVFPNNAPIDEYWQAVAKETRRLFGRFMGDPRPKRGQKERPWEGAKFVFITMFNKT